MNDPRLKTAEALLDDARCLLVDVVDDRPEDATVKDYNNVDAARQFINSGLVYIQKAQGETP